MSYLQLMSDRLTEADWSSSERARVRDNSKGFVPVCTLMKGLSLSYLHDGTAAFACKQQRSPKEIRQPEDNVTGQ